MTTKYPTLAVALSVHQRQIEQYGGAPGVRSPDLLQAALFRPQTGYYHNLLEEAAALWESLAQNHPFIDGNKRTAFAVTYVFLRVNGIDVTADAQDAFSFINGLYQSGTFAFDELVKWLQANTARMT